ncbi:MAG: PhoU domain-containing protein [Xanthomonadales bacterium]
MSHYEERLEADLMQIRDWLWNLGEAVEMAVSNAKKTLLLRDEELAYATVLNDNPINRDSRECDRLCHRFIARHLPGAGHLREMASTIRVNVALERVGDYAVTICREALQLKEPIPERFSVKIDSLADDCIQILRESRKAFRDGNAEQAKALMQRARRVQTNMDIVYDSLFAADDRLDGRTMMALFIVFNLLKRVADQAKNICDQTVYAVRGIAKIPKVYKVLFLDKAGSSRAQLAVAIGRKIFPETSRYCAASPTPAAGVPDDLRSFLEENGLPDENLEIERLQALEHDFGGYDIIVSLSGPVSDYLDKVPFHSSALDWSAAIMNADTDFADIYRALRNEIGQLMTLLAGDEAD